MTAMTAMTAMSGSTAMTAMSGNATAAGNYDGTTAAGLLLARDGIVGQWAGATLNPRERGLNEPANLEDWSQMVRTMVVLQDLLANSGVAFSPTGCTPEVAFYHFNRPCDVTAMPDTFEITAQRLAAFIRPGHDEFVAQLELVRDYADLRADRLPEILSQAGYPVPYMTAIADLHPGRKEFTHELLGITQVFATHIVLAVKQALACHRPDAFSPQVQPVIPTPGHGTLPSGHATEAFAMAVVLARLMEVERGDGGRGGNVTDLYVDQLMRQAARIAINRTVAGVHFPADSMAGAMLGLLIGQYLVARATGTGCLYPVSFDGTEVATPPAGVAGDLVAVDFRTENYLTANADPLVRAPEHDGIVTDLGDPIPASPGLTSAPLKFLWDKSVLEWKKR
ncbi:phosphatase PAP2 family protein [uncultured Roseobacter sp.]|uniref:phosphatase PAP2 family protein n=1 Tax=uncultured Roseobacter sp. TaxID=114847 RepID=UPI0026069CC5|nr:phosphatase PAP2 family protein [uncultured Roseobacter sp.]